MNTKNQVIGNTYDAAGNLWIAQPGNVQYTYDAENHLVSTAGQTYLYDGDGKRVEKATNGTPPVPNKLYWYGADDSPVIETDAAGNDELRTMIRDAVSCHFPESEKPSVIRLHMVKDEVIPA